MVYYQVSGKAPFPLQMLAHDSAWPSLPADAAAIAEGKAGKRVKVLLGTSRRQGPDAARWASLGYKVSHVAARPDPTRAEPTRTAPADDELAKAWDDLRVAISRMSSTLIDELSARHAKLGSASDAMDLVVKGLLGSRRDGAAWDRLAETGSLYLPIDVLSAALDERERLSDLESRGAISWDESEHMQGVLTAALRAAGINPSQIAGMPPPGDLPEEDAAVLCEIGDWTAPHEVAARLSDKGMPLTARRAASALERLARRELASFGKPNGTYRRTAAGDAAIEHRG